MRLVVNSVQSLKIGSIPRLTWNRHFSVSSSRREIRDVESLPERLIPSYQGGTYLPKVVYTLANIGLFCQESNENDLLSLQWPAPPRNIFVVKKNCAPQVTESLVEFIK